MSNSDKKQAIIIEDQGSLSNIKKHLSQCIAPVLGLDQSEIYNYLQNPKHNFGHLALPVFPFSKTKKENPKQMAEQHAQMILDKKLDFLESVTAVSGFINFQFTKNYIKEELIKLFLQKHIASFQHKKETSKPEHLVIDFASPNVAKYMNIGHLRAAAIGQAIVNLAKQFQYQITTINHLGDWGSQFGKLLWAYKKWHKEYDFKTQAFESLVKLYTRFHKEAESDASKLKEATGLFQKLEAGDQELQKLWKNFVELSLKDYDKYWEDFNIKHDLVQGESFYKDMIGDLNDRLQQKDILKESEGAQVVFLDDDKPPCLIKKSDGASTYAARDLCSAIYRFETLKADKNIYVTGNDQKLHFQQIFQTLGKMGFVKESENCHHIFFGMYRFKGEGKMSSRQGKAVYLKDLLEQSVERVKTIIEERRPELKNKDEISKQIGVGALIFNDLSNDSTKDIDFDWDKVLDFEGHSGPFVQYTLVRCVSLLKKSGLNVEKFALNDLDEEEMSLAWTLLNFEQAVFKSFINFKPHILARYLLDLSKQFNHFYATNRILDSERKQDRVVLVQATHCVLSKGLKILNVPQPDEM